MSIQGRRLIEILEEVKSRGVMTVVGGPMATVEPEVLEGLADVIFIGEADETWPQFLNEWEQGYHKSRYEQQEKTDVTKLPLPRIDLLKINRYMFGSLQISRGCPFTCEFCDIIVTFGRRPRLKTSEQVLAELEAFQRAGLRIVFVVDDNLIGNKKAIKPILRDIVRWQQDRAYPLTLFTEASLDLAEDDELMELMGLLISKTSSSASRLLTRTRFEKPRSIRMCGRRLARYLSACIASNITASTSGAA